MRGTFKDLDLGAQFIMRPGDLEAGRQFSNPSSLRQQLYIKLNLTLEQKKIIKENCITVFGGYLQVMPDNEEVVWIH